MAIRRIPRGLGGLPIQIDYTAKDFEDIREVLLDLSTQLSPQWTDKQAGDIGVTILEAVSYLGDILSYSIDRGINESYLATAQTRSSVVNLLRLIGYELTPRTPSTVNMVVRTSQNSVTLPAGFTVSVEGDDTLKYELLTAVTLPTAGIYSVLSQQTKASNTFASATILTKDGLVFVSGESVTETTSGTGLPDQVFFSSRDNVCSGINGNPAVTVTVNNVQWSPVDSLLSYESNSQVYSFIFLNDGSIQVKFGDGVNGQSPALNDPIVIEYRVGGGEESNNAGVGTITSFSPSVTGLEAVINLTQPNGGSDAESLESAKKYGPLSLRALDRCVTLQDFETIARKTPGVSVRGARAVQGDAIIDVKLYISVQGDDPSPSGKWYPQLKSGSEQLGAIGRYVVDRMTAPTRLVVLPATKVQAYLKATVYIYDNYLFASVKDEVDTEIQQVFSEAGDEFGQVVPLSKVSQAVENISGVDYINIEEMHRIPSLLLVNGSESPLVNSTVTFSGFNHQTVSAKYTLTFTGATNYTLSVEGRGMVTEDSGVTKVFSTGVDETVSFFNSFQNDRFAEEERQFVINVTTSGSYLPSSGDTWSFSTDGYRSNINTEAHEVIFAEIDNVGLLDSNFFELSYVGGIGNGNA